jgi:hypothetical protein
MRSRTMCDPRISAGASASIALARAFGALRGGY